MRKMQEECFRCYLRRVLVLAMRCPLSADDWPQWRGPRATGCGRRRGSSRVSRPHRFRSAGRCRSGSGYCGPTVAEGRVYVTDRQTDPQEVERVHCFDWQTGRPLWTYCLRLPLQAIQYTAGPRASVTIDDRRAYALGTMGHLVCLDAATGEVLWKKQPGRRLQDPRARLGNRRRAVGRGRPADRRDGRRRWRVPDGARQEDRRRAVASPERSGRLLGPDHHRAGRPAGVDLLDGAATSRRLDPASGKVYWTAPLPAEEIGDQRPHAGRAGRPALRSPLSTTARSC